MPQHTQAYAGPVARKLHSLSEVLDMLPLSRTQLYREMNAGRLPFLQVGKRRLFEPEAIDAFIAALKGTDDNAEVLIRLMDEDGRIDLERIPPGTTLADLEAAKRILAQRRSVA